MKRLFFSILLLLAVINFTIAQQPKPELLKQPDTWEFERFDLPPSFAPQIIYKGFEELRFAPGMFKKDSLDYFTYAFAASIDSVSTISSGEINTYLVHYFKGLCSSVASDKKMTIDTSVIKVVPDGKKNGLGKEIIYNFTLTVLGVFTDGGLVKLNLEAKVIKDDLQNKLYLLFIISPQPKSSFVWKKLFEIQKDFKVPGRK